MRESDDERRRFADWTIRRAGVVALVAAAVVALNGSWVTAGLLALVGITAFAWAAWIQRTS